MPQPDSATAPAAAPPAAREKRPAPTPYPHLFRLLHWVLPASMIVAVASGLSLSAVSQSPWSLFSGNLPRGLLSGRVDVIHLIAAAVFLPSLVAVLPLYWRRKVRRRATHVALLGGGAAMIASGLVLLFPVGPPSVYWIARAVHFVAGLIVLPVALLWHTYHGVGPLRGLLVPAFRPWASPRWRQLLWLVPLALVSVVLIFGVLPPGLAGRQLVATSIDLAPGAVPDDLAKLPWDDATPLRVELAGGIGFDRGRTEVTLRALHNGDELFVLAEWDDPTENRSYTPWEKTDDGWRHRVTSEGDETVYYEDKFSFVFPTAPDWRFDRVGCALYCHADSGRPYGYKAADQTVDVWHWKAVRTDPVGQLDDKHWLGFNLEEKNVARHGDPKKGGGYKGNAARGENHPAFLPDGPSAVRHGAILSDHAVKWTPQAEAEIPPGTVVPGIVAAPFQGDRGDVTCQSRHEDGRWRLFIRRRLDTGSEHDTKFVPGGRYPFACAAFDHTSNRHAYDLSSYRLVLEE